MDKKIDLLPSLQHPAAAVDALALQKVLKDLFLELDKMKKQLNNIEEALIQKIED